MNLPSTYPRTLRLLLALVASLPAWPSFAGEGTHTGGGGDASERQFHEIRADILKWIGEGGGQKLKLPSNVSYEFYQVSMSRYLAEHTVVVTFVTTAQEAQATLPELKVSVDGKPKTCRGFLAEADGAPHILCNSERFAATAEAERYPLVHHEYAGLAGVERNSGASSDYTVSNQISGYLAKQTVLRLSVKRLEIKHVSSPEDCDDSGYNQLCGTVYKSSNGTISIFNPYIFHGGLARRIYAGINQTREDPAAYNYRASFLARALCRRAGYAAPLDFYSNWDDHDKHWSVDRVALSPSGEIEKLEKPREGASGSSTYFMSIECRP